MKKATCLAALLCFILTAASVQASLVEYFEINGLTLAAHSQGGTGTTVSGTAPDYDWYYGCSPTSAGMLAGYYDRYGYQGQSYGNLLPGAVAETNTFVSGVHAINGIIASPGHITDYYSGGTGASGDDVSGPFHSFNSLADFMGTSQDAYGNGNGTTKFWFYPSGSKLFASNMTPSEQGPSGMYGIWEYFNYRGYNTGNPGQNFYNQYVDAYVGSGSGFTFAEYQNEIDNDRPVILHVEGHSMFGYGYDAETSEILLHDTWTQGEKRMVWGGSYSGRGLLGVTVVIPQGGNAMVPLPGAVWLLGSGLMGLYVIRKKHKD